jgi:hypothetical protein
MFTLRVGKVLRLLCLAASATTHAQSFDSPPGNIQAKVQTACTECHDASIIRQQRLSAKSWTKEVDKMIKWGAFVEPGDRAAFIEFLSTSYPPDKPPDRVIPAVRTRTKCAR